MTCLLSPALGLLHLIPLQVRVKIDASEASKQEASKSREQEEHGFLSNGVSFFVGFGWVVVLRDLQETDELGWFTGERLPDGLFGTSMWADGLLASDLSLANLLRMDVVVLNKAWWGGFAG